MRAAKLEALFENTTEQLFGPRVLASAVALQCQLTKRER